MNCFASRVFLMIGTIVLSSTVMYARHYEARTGRFLQIDPKAQLSPSTSPYAYVLNNPLRNIDPDGQEVKVYTERLGSTALSRGANGPIDNLKRALAWIYGPRHTFIRVTTDKVDAILELGGPSEGRTTGSPLRTDLKIDPEPRPGQEEFQVNRPQGVGEKDFEGFENKILQIYEVIKGSLPDYDPTNGPNSNGFIRFLVEAAGGGVNLPEKAWKNEEIQKYWEQYKKALEEQNKKDEHQRQQN